MKTKLIVFRLQDPMGNKESLEVSLNEDNSLSYSLYGSWQPNGTAFALSNLQMKNPLPASVGDHKSVNEINISVEYALKSGVVSIKKTEILNELPKQPNPSELPRLSLEQCRELEDLVLDLWKKREKGCSLNPKFKKTIQLQSEFMMGFIATTEVLTRAFDTGKTSASPNVIFSVMRGDYILKSSERKEK